MDVSRRTDEPPSFNVVLVEDHVALRKGLELLLRQHGHHVVGTTEDAEAAFDMIRRRRPHVAVIDLDLPNGDGANLTRRLLEDDPELGILLYTGVGDPETLAGALDSGARGFALKAGSPPELLEAVVEVGAGGSYVDPRLRPMILGRETTERVPVLTPREREILALLASGLTGEEIAARLFLSPETIRTHVRNAMEKLEASTRAHAIVIALRQGEIEV